MAAKRTSVYLVDRTLAVAGEGDSLSGRLNQIVARYDELMRVLMPEFTKNEWCAIFDANNGTILDILGEDDEVNTARGFVSVWANVADSQGFKEKWEIDVVKLSGKLRELETPQKIAVIEAIQTFWEHHQKPTDDAIAIALRRKA